MFDHRLEQVENELGSLAMGQKELQQAMRASEECLLKHIENMFARFSTHGGRHNDDAESSRGPRRSLSGGGSLVPKIMKLDFPCYDGMEDLTEWICRVEQFFEFQCTEKAEKLPIAGYHLDGDVQLWCQRFKHRREGVNWELSLSSPNRCTCDASRVISPKSGQFGFSGRNIVTIQAFTSSTKKTPFEIVYGREPPTLLAYVHGTSRVEFVDKFLLERNVVIRDVTTNLKIAQERIRKYYDEKRTERNF
ncbi:hypothetical protein F0562_006096 [Nyssa sinensis]|uniref:Retrotransposon gag domain-containing protein n=1 Tax=Nyssa sinensis TaxID=561372 RepID=A0A5J5AMH6_9ASTE|nr:hypothetical protein F0562_006096 [Nyssa sinensis]